MTELLIDRTIARVKAGCVEDYAAVVGAYYERLRATLATYCPPRVEADEIAHLAFVEAYRQLARYTPGTNFFAWLCAIARHRLMTECEALRRQARNRDNYFQYVLIERLQVAAQRDTAFDDARLQFLEECLLALSPEARSLIEGRYDDCRLFLSPDENPENRVPIAWANGTVPDEWTKSLSQQSPSLTLTAGKQYYLDVLRKSGTGPDHLAVAWQPPGGQREVIPGKFLSPFKVQSKGEKR